MAAQTPQATRGNTTKSRSANSAATARKIANTVHENTMRSAGRDQQRRDQRRHLEVVVAEHALGAPRDALRVGERGDAGGREALRQKVESIEHMMREVA
jgi:hypothetical protein